MLAFVVFLAFVAGTDLSFAACQKCGNLMRGKNQLTHDVDLAKEFGDQKYPILWANTEVFSPCYTYEHNSTQKPKEGVEVITNGKTTYRYRNQQLGLGQYVCIDRTKADPEIEHWGAFSVGKKGGKCLVFFRCDDNEEKIRYIVAIGKTKECKAKQSEKIKALKVEMENKIMDGNDSTCPLA